MSNESNNSHLVGMNVMARLPVHGVTWTEANGWSNTPGIGLATVVAAHADGSLDLEVAAPFETRAGERVMRAPELVCNVPHRPMNNFTIGHTGQPCSEPKDAPAWWPVGDAR